MSFGSRVEFTFWLIYRSAIKREITLLKHQTLRTRQSSSRFASEKTTAEQDFDPGTSRAGRDSV
ncbi:hypothetical protein N7465_011566 [Penicillium sp. CMV-2018d]|nr:hypothetical protein N7465_011566 [Penicillium sp. CMV-2018d]